MTSGRRVHERFAIDLPVTVLYADTELQGRTQNVSLGGALLSVSGDISFGAEVKVRLVLPPLKEEATVPATVRWLRDGMVGIQFGSLRAKEVWALNQMFKGRSSV